MTCATGGYVVKFRNGQFLISMPDALVQGLEKSTSFWVPKFALQSFGGPKNVKVVASGKLNDIKWPREKETANKDCSRFEDIGLSRLCR